MTLPRDIHTGKMPRVYDTILSLGGVLIPMQQDLDGNVLAHYPDGTTRSLTAEGSVDFTHDGQIPRVAGGSPVATFDSTSDRIDFDIPAGDDLQMHTGGTWIALVTPASVRQQTIFMKSDSGTAGARNGYTMLTRPGGYVRFNTSNSADTVSTLTSPAGAYAAGERMVIAYTQAGTAGKLYKNGQLLASGSMQIPADAACPLAIGNTPPPYIANYFIGGVGFVAATREVLGALELQAIAAQCGPLG